MARPRIRLKRHNIRVTQFTMKRDIGTRRKGQFVSKAYAKKYPRLVYVHRQLRSRLTGWNLSSQSARKDPRKQKKVELLQSKLFAKTKMAQARMTLLDQVRILSGREISSMLKQSPDLGQFLSWALSHADILGLTEKEREAFQKGL